MNIVFCSVRKACASKKNEAYFHTTHFAHILSTVFSIKTLAKCDKATKTYNSEIRKGYFVERLRYHELSEHY